MAGLYDFDPDAQIIDDRAVAWDDPELTTVAETTGTLAVTNAADTSTGVGTTTVTGTLARTNANDTLVGGTINTGSVAYTNANDTSTGAGTTTIKGTLAVTNNNDTLYTPVTAVTPTPAGASGRRYQNLHIAQLREDDDILVLI